MRVHGCACGSARTYVHACMGGYVHVRMCGCGVSSSYQAMSTKERARFAPTSDRDAGELARQLQRMRKKEGVSKKGGGKAQMRRDRKGNETVERSPARSAVGVRRPRRGNETPREERATPNGGSSGVEQ